MKRPALAALAALAAPVVSCGRRPAALPPAQRKSKPAPRPGAFEYPEFVPRKLSLVEGEKLVYAVEWTGLHAGEATMTVAEVSEGRARIEIRVRSNRFVDVFYRVRDRGWCLIDTERGCTLGFYQKKREGRYRAEEEMKVDYEKMVARFKYRRPERPEKVRELPLPSPTQDAISCLYVLRAFPFELGKEVAMTVSQRGKNWVLRFTLQKVETLKFGKIGRRRVYRTKPQARFPGLFARKGEVVVWIDVETGTVLRTRVDLPIGWITVTLVRAEKWP